MFGKKVEPKKHSIPEGDPVLGAFIFFCFMLALGIWYAPTFAQKVADLGINAFHSIASTF